MEASRPKVTFRPLDDDNRSQALALRVHPDQERFVPTVALSLGRIRLMPEDLHFEPTAIYWRGKMAGFFVLERDPTRPQYCCISGFLIAKDYQGRGLGSAAIGECVRRIEESSPACRALLLAVHPENHRARRFYEKLGFEPTGLKVDGEDTYRLLLA